MRQILASMVRVFPSLTWGETVEYGEDFVEREGLYYKKSSDIPFTGKVTGKEKGSIKNGKKVGPWIDCQDSRQITSKGNYKYGKRVGPWVIYFDNGLIMSKGNLTSKGNYKYGKKDGPWVGYWDNGKLESKGTYKDGEMDGPWFSYWENGTVNDNLTGT